MGRCRTIKKWSDPIPDIPHWLAGAHRRPSQYLEGHPRLCAPDAADQLEQGRGRCVWEWSGDGLPFAYADVQYVTDRSLQIELVATLSHVRTHGLITVEVRQAKNYSNARRFSLFVAPCCDEPRQYLVYHWEWRCDRCSGLLYRTQAIGAKVAAWEKLDRLEQLVGKGRPKGMHSKTFRRLRSQCAELQQTLGDDRSEAPPEYQHILRPTWVAIPPAEEAPPPFRASAPVTNPEYSGPLLSPVGPNVEQVDDDGWTVDPSEL